MRGVIFNTDVELGPWLDEYLESKPSDFYQWGIANPVERCREVIRNKGEYIVD